LLEDAFVNHRFDRPALAVGRPASRFLKMLVQLRLEQLPDRIPFPAGQRRDRFEHRIESHRQSSRGGGSWPEVDVWKAGRQVDAPRTEAATTTITVKVRPLISVRSLGGSFMVPSHSERIR
jgi:hypothetical protein